MANIKTGYTGPKMRGGLQELLGDGITTVFSFPHNFNQQPTTHWATRGDDFTGNLFQTETTALNIQVTFLSTPPSIGSTIKINWGALL